MDSPSLPRIVFAEWLDDGVVVTFGDGRCAFYPAALLDEMFPQAKPAPDDPEE